MRASLIALLSALVLIPGLPADAAVRFTQQQLTTVVSGRTVDVTANVRGAYKVDEYGIVVRANPSSAKVSDVVHRRQVDLTRGVTIRGRLTLPPGSYTVKVWVHDSARSCGCQRRRVGEARTFTVAAPTSSTPPTVKPGWVEDFNTNAAPGQFLTTYKGSVSAYDDNQQYKQANLSASGGALIINLPKNNPSGGAVVLGPPENRWGRTYGTFSIRFRVTEGHGYGAAFMLWPSNAPGCDEFCTWSKGEIDFPEGHFDDSINLYHHPTPCDLTDGDAVPHCASHDSLDTNASWRVTHTAKTVWTSTSVKYYLDGVLLKTVTHDIPTTDHRMTVQVAPNGGPLTAGQLLIDRVEIS